MKFIHAIGERAIVKVVDKEKDPVIEVKNDNFGVLVSIGEECTPSLQGLLHQEVMFAENSSQSLGKEDGFEYLLLHKSAILAY